MKFLNTIFITLLLALPSWAEKPHAVIIVGTHHYSPEKSMPLLAQELEKHGFRTTVILPEGNPEQNKNGKGLPGLEILEEADLAIFFLRFLTLNEEQFAPLLKYIEGGKPVVGFRTSTHAFKYANDHPLFRWNQEFGREVLGTSYVVHQSGGTELEIVSKYKDDPIFTGMATDNLSSSGTLYLTRLQPGCKPLLLGHGKSKGGQLREGGFGTFYAQENETDIVAWTWTNRYGAPVFCSSLGHINDFGSEPLMRFIINGIRQVAGLAPIAAETAVSTFELPLPAKHPKKKK
jgi:type 1 glutamine amidotransferase